MEILLITLITVIAFAAVIGAFLVNSKSTVSSLEKSIESLGESLRNEFFRNREELSASLKNLGDQQEKLLGKAEDKLEEIRKDNNEKLEKMRETVDEKLHKTLEERLGQSFKQVSERLEEVHKGLGEMQTLADGVGDLKKVLSNVKTRGIMGEIQLSNILEQILTGEQYEKNVQVKDDSGQHVEFAVKLPGKDKNDKCVWLPIDSKFPLEVYGTLVEAYDKGDAGEIEKAQKDLEKTIKKCARDISEKYISPPESTDFGIMFLPIEGLYAEVTRYPGLLESLQRNYKVNIAGPTTLAAILSSLHMGFRTLAIERRSSEVWRILSAVKTEFGKFGGVLEKAKKKINQAGNDIEELVGTRTRVMERKLKEVENLPEREAGKLIDQKE